MTHISARRLSLPFTLVLVGACSAAPAPAERAEISSSVSSKITGGTTLVVGPAEVWTGVASAADAGLRLDIRAEALLDGVVVASGELRDVAASRGARRQEADPEVPDQAGDLTGFKSAILRTVELARPTTGAADGAILDFRVSVRRACPNDCGAHAHGPDAGTARIWFNGAATDRGAHRDAGSRFFTTVDGVTTNQYLRAEGPLAIPVLAPTAGTAATFLDMPVDSSEACPDRTFTEVGTWSEVPAAFTCQGNLERVLRDPVTGRSLAPEQRVPVEERIERVSALWLGSLGVRIFGNIFFPRFGVQTPGFYPTLAPSGPKTCDALGKCTQPFAVDLRRVGLNGLTVQDRACSDLNTLPGGTFAGRVCFPSSTTTVHLSGVLTTRPGPGAYTFTFDEDYETAGYYGGIPGYFLTDETRYAVKCTGSKISVPHYP